jgi:hypothetical protein
VRHGYGAPFAMRAPQAGLLRTTIEPHAAAKRDGIPWVSVRIPASAGLHHGPDGLGVRRDARWHPLPLDPSMATIETCSTMTFIR